MGIRFRIPPRRVVVGLILLAPLLVLASWWGWRWLSAESSLRAARQALERRDFASARHHLAAYLAFRPHDASAHFLAARTARRAGLLEEAQRHLEQCERLGGMTEPTQLEWLLLRVQQGDLKVAARLKATIPPDHPDVLLVLEALVRGYLQRERLQDALEALGLWLGQQPDSVPALIRRGWIWERLGRSPESLRDYGRAVEIEPDNKEARLGLAQGLARLQPGAAARHYECLRQRSPEDASVLVGLARCYTDLGRAEEAGRLLDEVLARHPRHGEALTERGRADRAAGRSAAAEGWLRKAVALAPDDREALYQLVQCLQEQHKTGEAEQRRRDLDRLTYDLKRLDELLRAVARAPHAADLRREAGEIALRHGREEEGLRWLAGALREDPGHGPTHNTLADYFERKGQASRAQYHRRLAGRAGS